MAVIGDGRRDGFWGEQCPAREPALTHAHDRDCADGHDGDQCCECGRRARDWTAPAPWVEVPEPINVNDRLRALGLLPSPAPSEDDLVVMTTPDHETEAINDWKVRRMGRKTRGRLEFLRYMYARHPGAVR